LSLDANQSELSVLCCAYFPSSSQPVFLVRIRAGPLCVELVPSSSRGGGLRGCSVARDCIPIHFTASCSSMLGLEIFSHSVIPMPRTVR
jgi:hypothetical protein